MKFRHMCDCGVVWDPQEDQERLHEDVEQVNDDVKNDPRRTDTKTSLLEMALASFDLTTHREQFIHAARGYLPAALAKAVARQVPFEGAVYEGFESAKHLYNAEKTRKTIRRIRKLALSDISHRTELAIPAVCRALGERAATSAMKGAAGGAAAMVRVLPATSWVSTVSTVAKIMIDLGIIARNIIACHRANTVLRAARHRDTIPQHEAELILEENPILACYMVAYNSYAYLDFHGEIEDTSRLTRTLRETLARKPKHHPHT